MKKIDIRKIYVGEILKQTSVKKITDNNVVLGHDPYYVWNYENFSQIGLFYKTLSGYKHILTDTIYPKPSKRTGRKYVINPENVEELVKCERTLCSNLVNKYHSYLVDYDVVKSIEDKINGTATFSNDKTGMQMQ